MSDSGENSVSYCYYSVAPNQFYLAILNYFSTLQVILLKKPHIQLIVKPRVFNLAGYDILIDLCHGYNGHF